MSFEWKKICRRLLGCLLWVPRLLGILLGVLFNRYTAMALLVVVAGDVWLETRGVPESIKASIRRALQENHLPLEFDWLQVGVSNGVVLQGIRGTVVTPAGPVQTAVHQVSLQPDWLELLRGRILFRSMTVAGGHVAVLDGAGKTGAKLEDVSLKLVLAGQNTLKTTGTCKALGVDVRVELALTDARRTLLKLFNEDSDSQHNWSVDKVMQARLAEVAEQLSEALPKGNGSRVHVTLTGPMAAPERWSLRGGVQLRDAVWRGVEMPRMSCAVEGNLDCLSVSDIRVGLTSLDLFHGQVTFYPRQGELEGACSGNLTGWTAVRIAEALNGDLGLSGKSRTNLAWILRLPVKVSGRLERSPLALAALRGSLACQVTGAELPVLGRCSGQVEATINQGVLTVDRLFVGLDDDVEEFMELKGSYSLVTGECKGDLNGGIKLGRRLADLRVTLPENLVKLSQRASRLQVQFRQSASDHRGLILRGLVSQPRVRLLDIPCREMQIPFVYEGGVLSLPEIAVFRRKQGILFRGQASCDLAAWQRDGLCRIAIDKVELHGSPSGSRLDDLALACKGQVSWRPSRSRLSWELAGTTYPDRLYRTYLRKWNIDSSDMLMHIDCSDSRQPMSFTLKMPEFSLEGKWKLEGGFSMGNLVFNGLPLTGLSSSYFEICPDYCAFQEVKAQTGQGDRVSLDLRVDYSPLKLTFSRGDLQGDPRIVASFFMSSALRDTYLRIFDHMTWSPDRQTRLRLPELVYQGGENWSVICDGIHVHAENVRYKELAIDDVNAIVGLNLPSSVTLETISINKDSWWMGGRMELELQGVRQCRFQLFDTLYGTDIRYLLDGLEPTLSKRLDMIRVSSDCIVSCTGSFFLDGEPRLRIDGKLKADQISFNDHALDQVNMTWTYDAGTIGWQILGANYLTGNVMTSGIYDLWEEQGKLLLRFSQIPLDAIHRKWSDSVKADTPHYKGMVSGELQVDMLHEWAGRDWHLNGNGHIAIRQAELWEVPLLSALNSMLQSATFGWLSSGHGQISELDADVTLLGASIKVPKLTTNGTIMSLNGSGEYRWADDWKQGNLHFLVNGIPVKGVKILSFMLSSLTGMFQAELTGTLEENHWKMRTFIDMLF